MKKLILVLMFISVNVFSVAPTKFMGVSYNRPFSEFKKVVSKRFKLIDKSADAFAYTGKFAGYDNAVVVIRNYKGKFSSAMIMIPVEYYDYADTYRTLCKSLISKYGNPTKNIAKFDYPYTSGDGFEWQAIELGKAKFTKKWRYDNSFLSIEIGRKKLVHIFYINTPVYQAKVKEQAKKNNSDF